MISTPPAVDQRGAGDRPAPPDAAPEAGRLWEEHGRCARFQRLIRVAVRRRLLSIPPPGYQNYLKLVPKESRKRWMPQTPDIYATCSKRAFDGRIQVR